jgi:hypothetical protein
MPKPAEGFVGEYDVNWKEVVNEVRQRHGVKEHASSKHQANTMRTPSKHHANAKQTPCECQATAEGAAQTKQHT